MLNKPCLTVNIVHFENLKKTLQEKEMILFNCTSSSMELNWLINQSYHSCFSVSCQHTRCLASYSHYFIIYK